MFHHFTINTDFSWWPIINGYKKGAVSFFRSFRWNVMVLGCLHKIIINKSNLAVMPCPWGATFVSARQDAPAHLFAPKHSTTGKKFATFTPRRSLDWAFPSRKWVKTQYMMGKCLNIIMYCLIISNIFILVAMFVSVALTKLQNPPELFECSNGLDEYKARASWDLRRIVKTNLDANTETASLDFHGI